MFNSHSHDCLTVTGTIIHQWLARFFNSYWHDSSAVPGKIFSFFYPGRIPQQWCSLLKNRAMYQEYDTWSSSYYIHSLFHVFLISIFPYISHFPFLIEGLQKGEIKSILRFAKFSYYFKNLSQNRNLPKTCQCSTDNFLSSRLSPYLWSLEFIYITGRWSEFSVKNAILSVWIKITTFFKRRVSIMLWSFSS